jgi:hypothetical protein
MSPTLARLLLAIASFHPPLEQELVEATVLRGQAESFVDGLLKSTEIEPWVPHPVAPLPLRGERPGALAGSWTTGAQDLVMDAHGHFIWTMHGCMGTTRRLGEARRDGGVVLLVVDRPDRFFGGGWLLDVVESDEGERLVPRARSKDDRSPEFPFARRAAD